MSNRINLTDAANMHLKHISPESIIMEVAAQSAERGQEIHALLGGKIPAGKCAVLAELERVGVITDIKPDGTAKRGPAFKSYTKKR